MSTQPTYPVPQRPEALRQGGLGGLAYWGDRKPPKNFSEVFRATAAAKETTEKSGKVASRQVATLRLYGPIYDGWFGISARKVSEALDELGDVDEVRVRINSPGGDAWEGMTILNMLRAHKAEVVAVVDGIAASAASYLAAGCDRTVMSPGTQMMIHDASAFAYGPADTMRKAAKFLDSTSNAIASVYADVAGGTNEEWRALMVETTWYTAQEALEAGLANAVAVVKDAGETDTAEDTEPEDLDSEVEDTFDLSMYPAACHCGPNGRRAKPGCEHRDECAHHTPKPPSASAVGSTHTEGGSAVAFSDEQLTTMRQKLGVTEDADEATIMAALDEALEERSEPTPPAGDPAVPEGHVVIPAAKLADLEAAATVATTTAENLRKQERDAFLDSQRTKYLPTSRAGWEAEYDRDPQGVRAHFEKAPVLIPTNELGHDNPVDDNQAEEDAVYGTLFPDEKAS